MTWVSALLVAGIIGQAAWGQAPGGTAPPKKQISPFAEYAGEWTSTFEGKVWLRLRLELAGDRLIGALVHSRDITLKDSGELKSVSEEQSGETIAEAVVNPDGLALTAKDADTQATSRYLMRLVPPAKDVADLRMVGEAMPPGMPKPKPWQLVKSGSATTNKVAAPH